MVTAVLASVTINDPQVTSQNTIPTVPCQMDVQGTAHLPAGDSLTVGSVVVGGKIATFQSGLLLAEPRVRILPGPERLGRVVPVWSAPR